QSQYNFKRVEFPWFRTKFLRSISVGGKAEKKNLGILREFVYQIIEERKKAYKQEKQEGVSLGGIDESNASSMNRRLTFLDHLIEIQSTTETSLTDQDIYDETATFTFEGHDTTASGLTWSLYLLSKHQQYQ
ncbi:unnamed protein product, partial [Allacma fusca]